MKVLILSCNTGGGHNSCARAIGTELQRRGHAYEGSRDADPACTCRRARAAL